MIDTQQSYSTCSFATIPASHDITPVVAEIGEMEFTGNLTPHSWYSHLKLPSGHTDLVVTTLLGEIVYQYRPGVVRDEATGEPLHRFKRFARDQFCAPLAYFEKKFGLTKDQVRQGLKRLEEGGYIRREYRDIMVAGRWVRGMTFIEPVPERIRAITPPPRPDARPAPGAVQRPKAAAVRQRSAPKDAVSAPEGAVSTPGGAVQIPLYRDTTKIPEETTTPPTPPPSRNANSSSWRSQQQEKSTLKPATPPPSSTITTNKSITVTAVDPATSTTTEADTPPPPAARPTAIPTISAASPANPAILPLLLFDFYLADLTLAQQAELCQRLARLPTPLAQKVLDEYNSAVGRKVQFRNKWGWFEFLIRAALQGQFIPTSDLAERRTAQAHVQAHAAAVHSPVSTPPARQPSVVWQAHQEELVRLFPSSDVGINLSPLRALEDEHTLWLEAPNTFVANWVRAHLPQIEAVLRPHIALPIRVCIG